jgi:NADH dehydrogenase
MYLVGFRNRVTVLIQWAWAYFAYQRGSRLITGGAFRGRRGAGGEKERSVKAA